MQPHIILILGLFLLTSMITATLMIVLVRKKKHLFRGKPEKLEVGKKGEGTVGGITYVFAYSAGSKNTPASFRVSIPFRSDGSFRLARETKFDRFFRRIGITNEIRTFDRAFDDRFYIYTNRTTFSRSIFRSPECRKAAMEIYDLGFLTIAHDGKTLSAVMAPFRGDREIDTPLLEEIVARLALLAKPGPIHTTGEKDEPANWKLRRIAAFAVPIALEIGGIAALVFGLVNHRPLDPGSAIAGSLAISIPPLILFLWIAVVLLRGRSTSHRELIIAAAIALTAFPAAFAGGTILFNGLLDRAAPTTHSAMVIDKRISVDDDDTNYHLYLESWRREKAERLGVSYQLYEQTTPGSSRIAVTTRPGRFGREWLVDYRIE